MLVTSLHLQGLLLHVQSLGLLAVSTGLPAALLQSASLAVAAVLLVLHFGPNFAQVGGISVRAVSSVVRRLERLVLGAIAVLAGLLADKEAGAVAQSSAAVVSLVCARGARRFGLGPGGAAEESDDEEEFHGEFGAGLEQRLEALLKCTGRVCPEQLSRGLSSFCRKRLQEVVDFYSLLSGLSSEVENVFELCDTVIYLLRDTLGEQVDAW